MTLFETPNIGIAVYNEGNSLEKTLLNLRDAFLQIQFKNKPSLFVCFNACSDNSIYSFLRIFHELSEIFSVYILSSKKGKLRAHQKIIERIDNMKPILFIDADIFVSSDAIKKLLEIIATEKEIMIASAYPYLVYLRGLTFYQRLLLPIINMKRIYPQIEISKSNVDLFHPYAKSDFERKSRIYFHGRCFIIRNKNLYYFPKDFSKVVGDDTFLSFVILKKCPHGSIKILYDAKVYSRPQLSIRAYFRSWHRIRKDIDNIYSEYPEFLSLKKLVESKINWRFILYELRPIDKIFAILYALLRRVEIILYALSKDNINLDEVWKYEKKEGF